MEPVTVTNLTSFLQRLGERYDGDAAIYLLGGGALCLARGGEEQPFTIVETSANFNIEWSASYRIDGDRFVISQLGQARTILGYPTAEILRAIRRAR